jgi:hypothetical protein
MAGPRSLAAAAGALALVAAWAALLGCGPEPAGAAAAPVATPCAPLAPDAANLTDLTSLTDLSDASGRDGDAGGPPPALSKTDQLFADDAPLGEFQILVAPEQWAWLQANATLEQYVPASVVYQGRQVDGAAVRYKGAYGSLHGCFDAGVRTCPKLSLKVSFNEFDKQGRFEGVRKLVFNSCNRDDSCLHERVAYRLFRDVGLTASRAVHALVRVNDEAPSLYLLVENVDKEFLEDHLAPADGNLYKEAWPTPEASEPEWRAHLKTNEAAGDVSRMRALADVLAATSDATFLAEVAPYVDAAEMLRYFAVDQIVHNWDGIWKFYCQGDQCRNHNYYLYERPGSQRIAVLPWDLDHTFNQPNPDMARSWRYLGPQACVIEVANAWVGTRAPQCDPLLSGLMRLQWDAFVAVVDALTAPGAPLSEAAILARLDGYRAMILPHIAADPLGPGVPRWRRAVAQMREVVRAQHRLARDFVAEQRAP